QPRGSRNDPAIRHLSSTSVAKVVPPLARPAPTLVSGRRVGRPGEKAWSSGEGEHSCGAHDVGSGAPPSPARAAASGPWTTRESKTSPIWTNPQFRQKLVQASRGAEPARSPPWRDHGAWQPHLASGSTVPSG